MTQDILLPQRWRAALGRGAVLVLGRAGMDLYADPPGTGIQAAGRFVAHLGGSAANIAAGLARQGVRTALVSCVSDDAVGRFCLAELDRYGVGRALVRIAGGGVRTSLAVVETRAEPASVIYRNGAADLELGPGDVEGIGFAAWGALVVTGTAMASESGRAAVLKALEAARAAGCVTVLDVDFRPYSWPSREAAGRAAREAAQAADIVVGNDEEFALLAGAGDSPLQAARGLAEENRRLAVLKLGDRGSVTCVGGREIRSGIYRVAALKPTGAGDAFMAGFLAALCDGQDLRSALVRGSATAAIVVAQVGCAPAMPDGPALDAFLACHPPPLEGEEAHAHPAP